MTREESDIILDQIKTYSPLMLKDYGEFLPFGIIVFDRTTPQVLMLDHENSSIFDHIEENMRYIEKQVLDKKATSGAECYLIKYGEMDAIMFKMILLMDG